MKRLTDRTLQSLKPSTKQYDKMCPEVRGFGVRVGKTLKSFILLARFPGSNNPTRRVIGNYPTMTLGDAREKARDWKKLLSEGKDPSVEEEKRRRAEFRKRENTFAAVCEEYFVNIKR